MEGYIFFLLLLHQIRVTSSTILDGLENSRLIDNQVLVGWAVDFARKQLEIAIVAPTSGWVGLGVSTQGSMRGADLWVLEHDGTRFHVSDMFAEDMQRPTRDPDDLQNVILSQVERNETHTSMRLLRTLVTCDDKNDVEITTAPQFLLYAFGRTQTMHYHGSSRGSLEVSLLFEVDIPEEPAVPEQRIYKLGRTSPPLKQLIANSSHDEIHAVEFSLEEFRFRPKPGSSFVCFSTDFTPQLQGTSLFVVGYKPVGVSSLLHHALVVACPVKNAPNQKENCHVVPPDCVFLGGSTQRRGYRPYPDGVYSYWGDDPTEAPCRPDDTNCRYMVTFQIHWENRDAQDHLTSFGMRFYFKTSPLKHEAHMLMVTTPHHDLVVKSGDVTTEAKAVCPGECTALMLTQPTHVFGVINHAHKAGQHISTRLIRNGKELEPLARNRFYDFNKQSIYHTRRVLLPGDTLVVSCEYDGKRITKDALGGYAADDEMCLAFILMYPRPERDVRYCAVSKGAPDAAYCGSSAKDAFENRYVFWKTSETVKLENVDFEPLVPLSREAQACNLLFRAVLPSPLSADTLQIPLVIELTIVIGGFVVLKPVLRASSRSFSSLPPEDQRNVCVYMVSLFTLSIALIMSWTFGARFAASHAKLVVAADKTSDGHLEPEVGLRETAIAIQLLVVVQIFELAAKPRVDTMLAMHHVLVLILTSVHFFVFYRTLQSEVVALGLIIAQQGIFEQPVYLALIRKKLGASPDVVSRDFRRAAIFVVVVKSLLLVCALIFLINSSFWLDGDFSDMSFMSFSFNDAEHIRGVFSVFVLVILALLYTVQIYQARVLWSIAQRSTYTRIKTEPSP